MKAAVIASTLLGATLAAADTSCSSSFSGSFEITVAQVTLSKRGDVQRRDTCGANNEVVITLSNGILTDAKGRTGYIASNYQFQFDGPPQAGALETSGFTICPGNLLALDGSTTFYECLSGDFYNLYSKNWAPQCSAINIIAIPCGSTGAGAVSQQSDGQIVGTTVVATTIVTALSDGQPQVITTTVPVPIYSTQPPVTQISDGQVQAPTGVVTQISDGQVQAPTGVVTQISDGQVQAPAPTTQSGALVTQISDGQVQAPTSTAPVVASTSRSTAAAATTSSVISTNGATSSNMGGSTVALVFGSIVAFFFL